MAKFNFFSIVGVVIFLIAFLLLIFVIYYIFQKLCKIFDRKFNRDEISKRRPPILTFIAGINFVSGLGILSAFKSTPVVPVMGIILTGNAGRIYYALTGIIGMYLGIGFLKLRKISLRIWMIEYIFFVVSSLFNLFFLSGNELLSTALISRTNQTVSISTLKTQNIIVNAFALIFCILLLLEAYAQRRKFST